MQLGSPAFEAYNRTLRRIMWADFVDEQMRVAREQQYKASIVEEAYPPQPSLASAVASARKAADRVR
jgi:hypothetical protein